MSKSFVPDPSRRPVLVAGLRTPFTRAGTDLRRLSAADLGVHVVRELLARADVRPDEVDELIFGCVGQSAKEANTSRVIALRAGLPEAMPAYTVHRNCASGMQAIEEGARRIVAGEGSVYVVGGTESMSGYPLLCSDAYTAFLGRLQKAKGLAARLRTMLAFRPGFLAPRVSLLEGLTDPTCGMIMGLTAERLADDWAITRREQDLFALASHQKAVEAVQRGETDGELAPVYDRGDATVADNGPREGQSLEALARLRPYFDRREGTVTVGNACPITDGAVALLLMSEDAATARGLAPLARLRSSSAVGLDPSRMGLGPALAAPKAIHDAGLQAGDVDLWEINEAFAAQVIACLRALDSARFGRERLGLPGAFGAPAPERLNVGGGAVALGHPVGATGARLVLTLCRRLRAQGGGAGVATLCVGGGQGFAQVWEAA
ncbi:MAG: thiolase family protein [Planctomycetota bacterium]